MAVTVEGALIGFIRGLDLVGARVWNEDAPAGATRPYVTLLGPLSTTARLRGDGGATIAAERLVQADLWQDRRLPRGGSASDPTLAGNLTRGLDGIRLDLVSGKVFRCHVQDVSRVAEPDESNLTHHSLTLSIKHDRDAL